MRCGSCGSDVKDDWKYCPKCGARRGGDPMDTFGRDLFSNIFGKFKNAFSEFGSMDRMSEKDMEALDLSPRFRKASQQKRGMENISAGPGQKRGFTVHITRGTGMPPKVSMNTYGDVDKEKLEKEINERFGIPVNTAEAEKKGEKEVSKTGGFKLPSFGRKRLPLTTEEPKADIRRVGQKVMVDINLPGVKSEADIDIKMLESSIEVRAVSRDKAYFKILTKPPQFRVNDKTFEEGVLHLEFSA
jgi:HSP20 family molecular chaperone IbpA